MLIKNKTSEIFRTTLTLPASLPRILSLTRFCSFMAYNFLLTDPEGRLLNLQHDNSFHNNALECHKGNLTPPSNRRTSRAVVKENQNKCKYSLKINLYVCLQLDSLWSGAIIEVK